MAKVEAKPKKVLEKKDFPYDWDVIENTWITMPDGCRLSSRIWHPKTDKPLPTECAAVMSQCMDFLPGWDIMLSALI